MALERSPISHVLVDMGGQRLKVELPMTGATMESLHRARRGSWGDWTDQIQQLPAPERNGKSNGR